MRNPRKEMMFNLKIQPASEPGNDFTSSGKVGCGANLVNSPFVTYCFLLVEGIAELSVFHHVCELKYDGNQ
jgi:hypothetical protein